MIQKATLQDLPVLTELMLQLWPDNTRTQMYEELRILLQCDDAACFLAFYETLPVGFAQCQLRRDYVEGTETSPVGYLEGIFVVPQFRNKGIAQKLLQKCENWSKEQGCKEFASDCQLDNLQSLCFHMHTGFTEANRIICFTKKL